MLGEVINLGDIKVANFGGLWLLKYLDFYNHFAVSHKLGFVRGCFETQSM